MQLFGGAYSTENGFAPYEQCGNGWGECTDPSLLPLPKYNFDYFVPAMSTVFVLMTGEWIDAMDPAIAVRHRSFELRACPSQIRAVADPHGFEFVGGRSSVGAPPPTSSPPSSSAAT
jgi:hypothetical protein